MKTAATARALAEALSPARTQGQAVAFVPTMGALHAGHLSLVTLARRLAPRVVVSIFVNPRQFGPNEDFDRYPRNLAADAAKLRATGDVDVLFAPSVEEIYPPGFGRFLHVEGPSEGMEGTRRPGHFDGVVTVVARLFDLVKPDLAVFGAKDGQQVEVVRKMTKDLSLPVEIVVGETVREPDGLAISSRNAYLSPEERRAAPALFRALLAGQLIHELGEKRAEKILKAVRLGLEMEPGLKIDSLDLVDAESMRAVKQVRGQVMLAGAVYAGKTRLIDNVRFG